MTVRNLKIDPITGDLVMANGNLVLVGQNAAGAGSDQEAITQAITSALRSFQGEWFLSPGSGIPYFQSVLVKNPDPRLLRDVFRDALLGVQGVQQVLAIDFQYTAATRALAVAWRVKASTGLLIGQTGVPS